jgi:hypothetical protein
MTYAASLIAATAAILLTDAPPAVRPPDARATGDLAELERGARDVLVARCLPCHQRSSPGAKAGALAVFDVDDASWSARVSTERLGKILGRLQSAPPAQRDAMARFVAAAETARGAGQRPAPPVTPPRAWPR